MSVLKSVAAVAGVVTGVLVLALTASGSSTTSNKPSVETPVRGGVYTHAFSAVAPITCIDPPTQIFHEALQTDRALVDSLVDQDPKTGEIVPWIATSWTISKDGKHYIFNLRKDGTFSDGTPINAAAVKANFDRIQSMGAAAAGASPLLVGLTSTKVLAPYTVEFNFSQPSALFLQALSGAVLGLISPKSLTNTEAQLCQGDFAGSGPFILKSFNGQSEIDLVRRVGYDTPSSIAEHTGDAYISELRLLEVPDPSVRADEVADGEIDSAALISYTDDARLKAAGVTLYPTKIPGLTETFVVNEQSWLAKDKPVREAILHAIDSKTIVDTVLGTGYGVASSPLGSTTPGYVNLSSDITYDPALSEQLLTNDGWLPGPNGYRVKNGQTLTLNSPDIGIWPYAPLLQQELQAVGIDLPLDKSPSAQATAAIGSGNYDLYKFQMTRDDPSVLAAVWAETNTGYNYARAGGAATLDHLLNGMETSMDPTVRDKYAAEVQKYLVQGAWAIPIDDRAWTYAVGPNVHGFYIDAEAKLNFYNVWLSKSA
jgi:peptide/nickel transport system substrate-binding protein